jgi:hypothetical protein
VGVLLLKNPHALRVVIFMLLSEDYSVGIEDMTQYLQQFLDTNFCTSVSFSYTEVDEVTGLGTRTTIEKNRYQVIDFE